jgi:hypothetical protein
MRSSIKLEVVHFELEFTIARKTTAQITNTFAANKETGGEPMKSYSLKMAILAGLIVMLTGCASLDQATLAKIAVEDKDSHVRLAAVEKLTDQATLAKIAVEDKDSYVRSAAVGNLTDQAMLAKIAVEATDSYVRSVAVGKLTDQAMLAKIAVEATDSYIRKIAIGKLTD